MDAAIVWLPANGFDSIKNFWEDRFLWCPMPVDKTIPPKNTSFIHVDGDKAQDAADPVDTELARSARSLSINRNPHSGPTKNHHEQSAVSPKRRAFLADTGRLQSFQLPKTIDDPPPQARSRTRGRRRRPGRSQSDTSSPASIKTNSQEPRPEPMTALKRQSSQPLRPLSGSRTAYDPSARIYEIIEDGEYTEGTEDTENTDSVRSLEMVPINRRYRAEIQGSSRESSRPRESSSSKRSLTVALNMNLDVEVQLKAKIRGDLTLALME